MPSKIYSIRAPAPLAAEPKTAIDSENLDSALTAARLLKAALGLEAHQHTPGHITRIGQVMKRLPHQFAVQPHPDRPGLRTVGIRCPNGSIRYLGCGESDRDVIDACLDYEGGLWAEDVAELLGIDRREAWAHLQALRVQGRCHRRGGGSQWLRGKAAPWVDSRREAV